MASFVNRRNWVVEWGQCDPGGIVFNSRFFEMFDVSTWLLFEKALGVRPHDLAATFGIIGIPLVDARAEFRGRRVGPLGIDVGEVEGIAAAAHGDVGVHPLLQLGGRHIESVARRCLFAARACPRAKSCAERVFPHFCPMPARSPAEQTQTSGSGTNSSPGGIPSTSEPLCR